MLFRSVKLCDAQFSFVIRFDGKLMNFASCFGLTAEGLDEYRSIFPRPANNDTVSGRAISQRAVVEIPDVEVDAAYGVRRLASTVNYRSLVSGRLPLVVPVRDLFPNAKSRASEGFCGSGCDRTLEPLAADKKLASKWRLLRNCPLVGAMAVA